MNRPHFDLDDLIGVKSLEKVRTDLAERFKARRKEAGLGQEELSERSGVSLGSLRRFEQTGKISIESLISLANVIGYKDDFDALFSSQHFNSIEDVVNANKRNK